MSLNLILKNAHLQLEQKGFCELFTKGWSVWKNEPGCFSPSVKKAAFAAGSVFAICYTGSAFLFASLALKEAARERAQGETRSPVIGHFAEWTMLGTFAMLIASRYPYEIAERGFLEEVHCIFDTHLKDPNLSASFKEEIYKEKLNLLKMRGQKFFFPRYPLPKGAIDLNGRDLMSIDSKLGHVYQSIEEELQVSQLAFALLGFQEILKRKSPCMATLIKVAMLGACVLALAEIGVYAIGIVDSAEQALVDYAEGEIPSIGGHSLEWGAEIMGMLGTIFYTVFSEISNVGRAKSLIAAFNKHIDALGSSDDLLKNRLKEIRDDAVDSLPQGFVFSTPSSLKFEECESPNEEEREAAVV